MMAMIGTCMYGILSDFMKIPVKLNLVLSTAQDIGPHYHLTRRTLSEACVYQRTTAAVARQKDVRSSRRSHSQWLLRKQRWVFQYGADAGPHQAHCHVA